MPTSKGSQERRKPIPDDFLFGKMIGEGSFSCVFLAKDIRSSKEVAIKVRNCHIFLHDVEKYEIIPSREKKFCSTVKF